MTVSAAARSRRPPRALRAAAPVFAALGDPTRLRLVGRLAGGASLSIAALTEGAGVSRQAVSKHLRVLDDAGLVRSRREGREHLWALDPARLHEARAALDLIAAEWSGALDRLKRFVEDGG